MPRSCNIRRCICISLIIAYIISFVSLYYSLWPHRDDSSKPTVVGILHNLTHSINLHTDFSNSRYTTRVVDIWGKAAIGLYLWQHVFNGQFDSESNMYSYGEMEINDVEFHFHTGPALTIKSVNDNELPDNLILVLNGREPSKVTIAQNWLNFIQTLSSIKNIGVVLLGNEQCSNEWLRIYMSNHLRRGFVKFAFIVYDIKEADDQFIFQWPLGVATYRSFPITTDINMNARRRFRCNFLGTIYPNSSRETLLRVIESNSALSRDCYVKSRADWVPSESKESMKNYVSILRDSDLTLNPIGLNTECYRIYEAMALGSVPVVEDRPTSVGCGGAGIDNTRSRTSSLRLLKLYNAPVIYVTDWNELTAVIEREHLLSLDDVIARRKHVIAWHKRFKRKMRDRLVDVVHKHFFN